MLVLPAELMHAQAQTCLTLLREAARAESGPLVWVDAAPLVRFDSSALAVLLECRRECRARPISVNGGQSCIYRCHSRRYTVIVETLHGLHMGLKFCHSHCQGAFLAILVNHSACYQRRNLVLRPLVRDLSADKSS